jgi:hypothetical protein
MKSRMVVHDPDEWISQHEPNWDERRMLARAILTSGPEQSVTEGPFTIFRRGEQITIEGARSTLILRDFGELDKIMAAIAWVDAISEHLSTPQLQGDEPSVSVEKMVAQHVVKKVGFVISNYRKNEL